MRRVVESLQHPDNRKFLLFAGGLLFAFLAYGGGLWELVLRWARQDEYSHGFFIPIIAGWLLWHRREALAASMGPPSWLGLVVLCLAVATLVVEGDCYNEFEDDEFEDEGLDPIFPETQVAVCDEQNLILAGFLGLRYLGHNVSRHETGTPNNK